jgi:hypothetical protein
MERGLDEGDEMADDRFKLTGIEITFSTSLMAMLQLVFAAKAQRTQRFSLRTLLSLLLCVK